MTAAADDRATLQRVLDATKWIGIVGNLSDAAVASHLAWFRSALSVPDVAQARGVVEWAARQPCYSNPACTETKCWPCVARALAAEPAARGEEAVLAQHTNERLGLSAYEDDTMNHGPAARGEQHEKPEAVATSTSKALHREREDIPRSEPPAPLDDAAVLERAAEIAERRTMGGISGMSLAKALRVRVDEMNRGLHPEVQPPAPEPDVFEAWGKAWRQTPTELDMDGSLREWFGPLVEALERLRDQTSYEIDGPDMPSNVARVALAQLRARALAERKD